MMEIIREHTGAVKAVVMDFDGTISTLRAGWEAVMEPLMLECIAGGSPPSDALAARVRAYIDESTGIQTVYQMQWLKEQAEAAGFGRAERDVWWYKDEYNRRLLAQVNSRVAALSAGEKDAEDYRMAGSLAFLAALKARGVKIYIASGTDDADVRNEAALLGAADYAEDVKGAPHREMNCSKEAVVRELIAGIGGGALAVIGDGKVEIQIGREVGARTIGLASDEAARRGVNPVKRAKLLAAGADAIAGDFMDLPALLAFLGLL